NAACIEEARFGSFDARGGGLLATGAFASDFKELIDRRNAVIAAIPETISGIGSGSAVDGDFLSAEGEGWIGKFFRNDFQSRGEINIGLGGEQIPVSFERNSLGVRQGKARGYRICDGVGLRQEVQWTTGEQQGSRREHGESRRQ